jgi:riboflavin transporter FmnP
MKMRTRILTGTTVLGALVVVFDYTLKFSGLKIRFPWLPFLKFDFTGIPIVLSFLLFGLVSGVTTSIIAFLAILVRSGDVISSLMKGLAEFSTVLGMALGLVLLKKTTKFNKPVSFALGISSRALIMICMNLVLIFTGMLTLYGSYAEIPIVVSLLVGAFNAIQGSLSILGGYFIQEALIRRAPSLISRTKVKQNSENEELG